MLLVPYHDLQSALTQHLVAAGFTRARASLSATLFAQTDLDGVYTHGIARFPRTLAQIAAGIVDPTAEPTLVSAFGAIERWQGNAGPGNLNADFSMARAIQLARRHGLGAVALAGTNHWMRGGTYAWQAADAGCFALCFTNTLPNLPAWGTAIPTLGNNPLVVAVPRAGVDGNPAAHIVLDMALSQYSYGTLAAYTARGQRLPYPGGFDPQGQLTTDPAAIERSARALPIGLWKGSGLALTLDLLAAMLSGGQSTHQIPSNPIHETNLSQVFLAIDPTNLAADPAQLEATASAIIATLHQAAPLNADHPPRYPGEQTLATRKQNLTHGIPINDALWQRFKP